MIRSLLAGLVAVALAGTTLAEEAWGRYVNEWYGYASDIPPGFSAVAEADNGDGGFSNSADGKSRLAVWGSTLIEAFSADAASRLQSDIDEGWQVSYQRIGSKAASWSGERAGRIFYARAVVLCDVERTGHFRLEYPSEARDAFDAIVKRLVKNFKHTECS